MYKDEVTKILKEAGITINGSEPWDVKVHDDRLYKRVLQGGTLALGEAYMDGWWDAERLDEFFYKAISARLEDKIRRNYKLLFIALLARLTNRQSKSRAFEVGEKHYDMGNDLYERMLDKRMVYTCGYWKNANTLDEAQEAKLDLVCRKIGLKPGERVLDIGCGWASFAKFAAEKYGAKVVGITVSKEQAALARESCKGLDIEIRVMDYRDLNEKFDKIVSLGMFEHVGYKNYRIYMDVASRCLKDDGLFLLHSIGNNVSMTHTDPWVDKYIFPNGMLPSITQVGKAIENRFVMEDWHNFGAYYDPTLLSWYKNFNDHWDELKEKYSERFRRMWNYYLLMSAGAFRARDIELWQIVLSKHGVPGGYQSVR
jgi:cyclopropane-fatty-acyl-phospholipid synthase